MTDTERLDHMRKVPTKDLQDLMADYERILTRHAKALTGEIQAALTHDLVLMQRVVDDRQKH